MGSLRTDWGQNSWHENLMKGCAMELKVSDWQMSAWTSWACDIVKGRAKWDFIPFATFWGISRLLVSAKLQSAPGADNSCYATDSNALISSFLYPGLTLSPFLPSVFLEVAVRCFGHIRLFSKVQSGSHCLNQLLPPPSPASQIYDLRPVHGHTHSLPSVKFYEKFCKKITF